MVRRPQRQRLGASFGGAKGEAMADATTMVRVIEPSHWADPGQQESWLRSLFPDYVDVVRSSCGMVGFVRGPGAALLAVIGGFPTVRACVESTWLTLPIVRATEDMDAAWDRIRAAFPSMPRFMVEWPPPAVGVPGLIRDRDTKQVVGLISCDAPPPAVAEPADKPTSAPPATERSAPAPRIRALAMQLFYVQYDFGLRVHAGRTPGLYSVPTEWSQAAAVKAWGRMDEDGQRPWLRFAEEIAVYAGHPVYESGPVGPMRIVPQLSSVRWMARAAEHAGEGPEPPPQTWHYLATELGTPLLGTPWEALVRDVYRDAHATASAGKGALAAALGASDQPEGGR